MIIYIYGGSDFKKDMHELLQHSNIKFRLGENGAVVDLDTLDALKNAISNNPDDIYLIDDSKIIKKNLLNNKIKFLLPKDGIEQDYLLDHGVGDMSVDSLDELAKYIKKKLDSVVDKEETENIQESIVEIVEDAYGQENDEDKKEYIQLDDELKLLLEQSDEPKVEQIDDISMMIDESENDIEDEDKEENDESEIDDNKKKNPVLENIFLDKEDFSSNREPEATNHYEDLMTDLSSDIEEGDENIVYEVEKQYPDEDSVSLEDCENLFEQLSFEEDFGSIGFEEDEETKTDEDEVEIITENLEDVEDSKKEDIINNTDIEILEEEINQGVGMSGEFSEFDSLNEADLLAALDGVDTQPVVTKPTSGNSSKKIEESPSMEGLNLGTSNTEDIAKLISQLLNNKTLEITIKVKD